MKCAFVKTKDCGFKLGEEKWEFSLPKIKYLGQIIDENGHRPDPSRADVIQNMPPLTNISTLQAFGGLTNYYQMYITNIPKVRVPLNNLLRKM